jgi:hypothetical protein
MQVFCNLLLVTLEVVCSTTCGYEESGAILFQVYLHN